MGRLRFSWMLIPVFLIDSQLKISTFFQHTLSLALQYQKKQPVDKTQAKNTPNPFLLKGLRVSFSVIKKLTIIIDADCRS